jgi:Domain of unknown function (DUF6431)
VILFISPSKVENNSQTDWAALSTESIPRRCPECLRDSVIGHGRRRKQAHDEHHDWIGIRRGLCKQCWKTITFLPLFSLPYTHYSLAARSQALQRYFVQGCSLELAVPVVKDANRVPDGSTLRRWFRSLDSAERLDRLQELQPESSSTTRATASAVPSSPATSFPFLRKMVSRVAERLACGGVLSHDRQVLSWRTVAYFLQGLVPLRR